MLSLAACFSACESVAKYGHPSPDTPANRVASYSPPLIDCCRTNNILKASATLLAPSPPYYNPSQRWLHKLLRRRDGYPHDKADRTPPPRAAYPPNLEDSGK